MVLQGHDRLDQAPAGHDVGCVAQRSHPQRPAPAARRPSGPSARAGRAATLPAAGAEFFKFWKLDPSTTEFLTHACALYRDDCYLQRPAYEIVERMKVRAMRLACRARARAMRACVRTCGVRTTCMPPMRRVRPHCHACVICECANTAAHPPNTPSSH